MKPETALDILGIEGETTPEEIDGRFRTLANEHHPDRGGTDQSMAELNEARAVALRSLISSDVMVPVKALPTAIAQYVAHEKQRHLVDVRVVKAQEEVRLRSTNKLRRYRHISGILAAVSTAVFFFGKEFPFEILAGVVPIEVQGEFSEMAQPYAAELAATKRYWTLMCFNVAIVGAFVAWFLSARIERVENKLRDFEERTGTKTLLYQVLKELLGKKIHLSWTLEEMADDISKWGIHSKTYGHAARTIGPLRFAQLLIDRAQQTDLVTVTEGFDKDSLVEYYTVVARQD